MKNKILAPVIFISAIATTACNNAGISGKASLITPGKPADTTTVVYDNFEDGYGFEAINLNHKRFIQLNGETKEGLLNEYYFDKSAKFDATLFFVDDPSGSSKVDLLINNTKTGTYSFDIVSPEARKAKEITIPSVNIPEGSRITLAVHADGGEKCRIEKLVLKPAGKFEGKSRPEKPAASFEIFRTAGDKANARKLFSDYVRFNSDSAEKQRVEELKKLRTPAEWKAQQESTRRRLHELVGSFPERTPLNARKTGVIDHPKYRIEKIIFESQPKYYVTGNLYVPKGRKFPVPGVILTCGHSKDGKGTVLYHEACLGLVLKGYTVFAFDPMGQGERSEYLDPVTKENTVGFNLGQHHYYGNPSLLIGWTFAGSRIWDGMRAIDYLVSRPEVDKDKIAVVGNSGGGEMTLLITAFDERVKVCAASHPGGSCEETYLGGGQIANREIFSLIPPRPCRINVGDRSGEERGHRGKIEDMQLFYEGLGYNKDLGNLNIVDGVHDMKQPKREGTYEWLNKWFGKEEEGKAEAEHQIEKPEALWCTPTGKTLASLGGETGQTLNLKRVDTIYHPSSDPEIMKQRIAKRIGLQIPEKVPAVQSLEIMKIGGLSVEKLVYEPEKGMIVPAVLIKPEKIKDGAPVYLFSSDKGKPRSFNENSLIIKLVKEGSPVLAIDARGTGETCPTPYLGKLDKYAGFDLLQWIQDGNYLEIPGFGRTLLGLRTLDVMAGVNLLNSLDISKDRKIIVIGEGQQGLCSLLSSIYNPRVGGVITMGTLTSYMELVKKQYYSVQNYFWVPGALYDFDIPDLSKLGSAVPQVWINPVNGLNEKVLKPEADSIFGSRGNLKVITPDSSPWNAEGVIAETIK